jgi:redox-sensitive bicupin YhaK (pirin superfamily)
VAIGEYRGERSPAEVFSPLAGYEVAVPGGDDFVLPVREDFEYGVVAVDGSAVVGGALIAPGLLAHLPAGLSEINLSPAGGRRLARFFVIGGVPFGEPLLMWWNFVARNGEETPGPGRTGWPGVSPRYVVTPAPRSPRLRCLPYPSGPADPKASGRATP